MKKEINLEELFGIHFNGLHCDDITKADIIKFGVDLAHKVLDLAAENADANYKQLYEGNYRVFVDRNSILQIKDWIK